MTDIEQEIRATLAAQARSVPDEAAPAHLLAPPGVPDSLPPRSMSRRRWLIPAAAAATVLVVGGVTGGLAATRHSGGPAPTATTAASRPSAPATFVGVVATGRARDSIALLSSTTGAVQKVLAKTGPDFTNNGLAVSPDGRDVYATWISRRSMVIKRITVATGEVTTIAAGSEPAVSPDGRYLAYVGDAPRPAIYVRDLRTGHTGSWPLSGVLPRCENINSVVWLPDGPRVVVQPEGCAVDLSGSSNHAAPRTGGPVVVTLDPTAKGARPHVVPLPVGQKGIGTIFSGGTAAPGSVLVDAWEKGGDVLYRVSLADDRATVTAQTPLPSVLPFAVDRAGSHLLYLRGRAAQPTRATINGSRLAAIRGLAASPRLAAAVW